MPAISPLSFCLWLIKLIAELFESDCIEVEVTERKNSSVQSLVSYHCVQDLKSGLGKQCSHSTVELNLCQSAKIDKLLCQNLLFIPDPVLKDEQCMKCGTTFKSYVVGT